MADPLAFLSPVEQPSSAPERVGRRLRGAVGQVGIVMVGAGWQACHGYIPTLLPNGAVGRVEPPAAGDADHEAAAPFRRPAGLCLGREVVDPADATRRSARSGRPEAGG